MEIKAHVLIKWILFKIHNMKSNRMKRISLFFVAMVCILIGILGAIFATLLLFQSFSIDYVNLVFLLISALLAISGFANFLILLKFRHLILKTF